MRLFNKIPKAVFLLGTIMLSGLMAGCGSQKEESYRSIQVYEIDGDAWVTREEVGEMELYANMQLQSNDYLRTGSESHVQLKLDEDKYILVEPDTGIRIEAEGNAQDSRTKIVLEEGSIVNRIENKLSENSSYEVETPGSTMAVRGTTFKVKIVKDDTGKWVSEVDVQEGKVDCNIKVKNADGTVTEQTISLEAGKKIMISGTPEGADHVSGIMEYTYEEYSDEVLNFIGYSEETNVSHGKDNEDTKEEENTDSEEGKEAEKEVEKEVEKENSDKIQSIDKNQSKNESQIVDKGQNENRVNEGNNTGNENVNNSAENEDYIDGGSSSDSGNSSGSGNNTDSGSSSGSGNSSDSGNSSGSGNSSDSGSSSGSGNNTDSGSSSGSGNNTDSGSSSGSGNNTDSGSSSGSGNSSDSGNSSGSGNSSDSGSSSGSGNNTDSGNSSGSGNNTDSGSSSGSGNNTDSGNSSGSGNNTDSGSSSGSGNNTDSGNSSGNEAGTDSGSTDNGNGADSGSTDSGNTDSGSTDSGNTDSGSTDSGSDSGSAEEETASYTVTFTYGGNTFATQTVTNGNKASEPILMPTASGAWYLDGVAFDFSATTITAATTLEWK